MKRLLPVFAFVSILVPALFAQTQYPATANAQCNFVDAKGFRQGYWQITAQFKKLRSPWMPTQIVETGNYIDSKPDGTWIYYYQTSGKEAEVSWKNGRREGPTKYFRENGTLISACEYVQNKREGSMTTFYPDGTMWMHYEWHNGRIDGPMTTFYPNGKIYEEGMWINGWWTSRKIYSENGKLIRNEK